MRRRDRSRASRQDVDKDIADSGIWSLQDSDERRLVFLLHGRHGTRRYALIRTDRDWLLHLTKDQPGPS